MGSIRDAVGAFIGQKVGAMVGTAVGEAWWDFRMEHPWADTTEEAMAYIFGHTDRRIRAAVWRMAFAVSDAAAADRFYGPR